jgi:hypothetical protein
MATVVWLVLCRQAPDLTAANMNQQCPQAMRLEFKTTLEVLTSNVTTTTVAATPTTTTATVDPIPTLDPALVASAFSVAFGVVVFFFLLAPGAGSVLSLIRRG